MSFIDRLHNEKSELHHKLTALDKFIGSDDYLKLSVTHQILLCQQADHMASYHTILTKRLSLLEAPVKPPVTSEYFPAAELDTEFPIIEEKLTTDIDRDGPLPFND